MEMAPIPSETYKLGFIGAGKMAESIARGVVRSGVLPPSRIRTSHSSPVRRDAFESFGITVLPRNDDVSSLPSPPRSLFRFYFIFYFFYALGLEFDSYFLMLTGGSRQ